MNYRQQKLLACAHRIYDEDHHSDFHDFAEASEATGFPLSYSDTEFLMDNFNPTGDVSAVCDLAKKLNVAPTDVTDWLWGGDEMSTVVEDRLGWLFGDATACTLLESNGSVVTAVCRIYGINEADLRESGE